MRLPRFAQVTAAMTFLLLIAGGLVTSTDSGLSVPDWPLSYGTLFPPMVGGIRYEHTHRLIAAAVAFLIAIQAVWLWRAEPRRWVRWLGLGALVAVLIQAVLGGITVLLRLPVSISVAHACLGQVVFCVVLSLALVTNPSWHTAWRGTGMSRELPRWCAITWGAVMLQVALGAMIRHAGHMVVPHMLNALVVTGLVVRVTWRIIRGTHTVPRLLALASRGMIVCCLGQLVLGFVTLLHMDHLGIVTAHVALGTVLMAGACVATVMTSRLASGVAAGNLAPAQGPGR